MFNAIEMTSSPGSIKYESGHFPSYSVDIKKIKSLKAVLVQLMKCYYIYQNQ